MRNLLLTLLLAMVAMSGCLESDEPADADASDAVDDSADVMVPETLVFTGSLKGVASGAGVEPACYAGAAQCTTIDVPMPEGTWMVTFTLVSNDGTVTSQGIPYGSDYELVALGQTSTNPGDEAEVISGTVTGPGTEVVEIQAWHDIDGSYELTVSFA